MWKLKPSVIKEKTKAKKVIIDNPGGQWLKNEVAMAESGKWSGSVTARVEEVYVPIDILLSTEGRLGEHNKIKKNDRRVYELAANIKMQGLNSLPFVNVEHDGTANINEGNHRIRAAKLLGIRRILVEISYFAGGERKQGNYSFEKLSEYAQNR
jgi:hypothetical protein